VAEQAIMLMLALNRKVIIADKQVKQYNFTLNNLIGFDLHGKTVGIIGMGRIGRTLAGALNGFGCKILAFDKDENPELVSKYNVHYCTMAELLSQSDIISLHIPLNDKTKYIINEYSISLMKDHVMIINTGRGGLVHTEDVLYGLKSGKIGYFGMDVYEREKGLFFNDKSKEILTYSLLFELMSLKNVIITPHQGFLTNTALQDIADTTIFNLSCWANGQSSNFEVTLEQVKPFSKT
jgi:D-lactate dehydrogenase